MAGGTSDVRTGFFPVVASAQDVHFERGGAVVVAAGNDLDLTQAGGQLIAAGRDLRVSQGGGNLLVAGNRLEVEQGGGVVMAARSARVVDGVVGLVLARDVELRGSRVLLAPVPSTAVAFGVGLLVGALLARRRRGDGADRSVDEGGPARP